MTYLDEARKRNPPQDFVSLLVSKGLDPISQPELDAINAKQLSYSVLDGIPEHLHEYARIYNRLTGQVHTAREASDWIDTFEDWKAKQLTEDHLKSAWQQAISQSGFTVGRPGALTVTAVGMKSKANATPQAIINQGAIEATKQMLDEKWTGRGVPMPEEESEKIRAILGRKKGIR